MNPDTTLQTLKLPLTQSHETVFPRLNRLQAMLRAAFLVTAAATVMLMATATHAGVLDEPWTTSTKQLQPAFQPQPQFFQGFERSEASSKAQLAKAARKEQKALNKLSDGKLTEKAKQGERAAQIILATRFSQEASTNSLTIGAANAALSDAVQWYSLAARRGYPGAAPIDGALPAFPIRVRRSQ